MQSLSDVHFLFPMEQVNTYLSLNIDQYMSAKDLWKMTSCLAMVKNRSKAQASSQELSNSLAGIPHINTALSFPLTYNQILYTLQELGFLSTKEETEVEGVKTLVQEFSARKQQR